jgi:hypothetical protein
MYGKNVQLMCVVGDSGAQAGGPEDEDPHEEGEEAEEQQQEDWRTCRQTTR